MTVTVQRHQKGKRSPRRLIFEILDPADYGNAVERIFDIFILVLIAANVLAVMLETVQSVYAPNKTLFWGFEVASVVIFTIEYLLRIWSCTLDPRYKKPFLGRLRYMFSAPAVVDLIAILPFYLPTLLPYDLRFIRAARLFRLLRILKFGRYSKAMKTMGRVLHAKKEDLLVAVFMVFILLIFASSLMYFVEHDVQPKSFSSIPASMWWGVVTLTTVGYGDVYPVTPLGRVIGAVISILGVGLFALPAGILGSGFVEEVQKKRGKTICPHCGREID